MSKRNRPDDPAPQEAPPLEEVVQAYAAQAAAADELAEVDTTHLDTPEANPNTVATLNSERDATARAKIQLDYERERMTQQADHERLIDRYRAERRVADATDARADRAVSEGLADADEAASELTEVREFERSSSPATATRRLMRAVRGWRKEEFAYAIAGSALSAAGISALLIAAGPLPGWAAPLIAVALEVVLTVRVIRLIGQRAELAEQHKGQALKKGSAGAQALTFLTAQIVGLLAVSVLLNIAGLAFFNTSVLGVLGALGAGGAALASWSAWQASVAAAATVRSNVDAWQGSDWALAREELRTRAAGSYIPVPEPVATEHQTAPAQSEQAETERLRRILTALAEEQIAALADRGTDALAVMLNRAQPPTEGGSAAVGQGSGAPSGTPSSAGGTPTGTPGFQGGSTPADQHEEVKPTGNCLRVLNAVRDLGVEVTNTRLAEELELSRTAVRKHRTWLWSKNFPVHPAGFTSQQSTE